MINNVWAVYNTYRVFRDQGHTRRASIGMLWARLNELLTLYVGFEVHKAQEEERRKADRERRSESRGPGDRRQWAQAKDTAADNPSEGPAGK